MKREFAAYKLLAICLLSLNLHASEISTDRFQHVKVQPALPWVLDLHYDETRKKATIACTGITQDNKRYISFYDPENIKVIQTITFKSQVETTPTAWLKLGGSFSENGKFFTIGQEQELSKPQLFYIYARSYDKREQEVSVLYPMAISKLISDYEDDRSYILLKTAECSSTTTEIPTMWAESFLYDPNKDTISCLGCPSEPMNHSKFLHGYPTSRSVSFPYVIAPIGIVHLSSNNSLTMQYSGRTAIGHYSGENGLHLLNTSKNRRYVVIPAFTGKNTHIFDRIANTEIEVSQPEIHNIDNTGTFGIELGISEAQRGTQLRGTVALRQIDKSLQPIKYSCLFPYIDMLPSTWEGLRVGVDYIPVIADKNYFLVRPLFEAFRSRIIVPKHNNDNYKPKEVDIEEEDKIILNQRPTIRNDFSEFSELQKQAPTDYITTKMKPDAAQSTSWYSFFTSIYKKSPVRPIFTDLGILGSLYLFYRACKHFSRN